MPQPIVPRHPKNPVGQTDKIAKARKAMFADLDRARDEVLRTWESLPVDRQNGRVLNRSFYEYLTDLSELTRIIDMIRQTIARGNGRQVVTRQTEASYRAGTAKAVDNLSRLSDDYTRTITQHLASQPVLRRAALAGSRVFEFMEGFASDTAADLGRVLFQAVQDGQNPRDTARDIRRRFDVSKSRAERIARTEITGALRRGRIDEARDAEDKFGIKVKMLWVSALIVDRSRPWHMQRHGNLYTTEEVNDFYGRGGNAINCVLPGAKMAGQFVAGSKAFYEGPAVRIVTAAGNNLSVTPNHPVMTDRGLVPAAEIVEGDNLIAHSSDVESLTGISALDGDLVDPTIEQVFSALVDIGHSKLAGVSAVDFHGDAAFMQENVNVVNIDGVLTLCGQSAINHLLRDLSFVKPDAANLVFRAGALGVSCVNLPASSFMGSLDASHALIRSKAFTLEPLSIAGTPSRKAALVKPSSQCDATDPVFLAQREDRSAFGMLGMNGGNVETGIHSGIFMNAEPRVSKPNVQGSVGNADAISNVLDSFTGFASFDEVVNVEQFTFTGHVYDLQDVSGLMVADNIVVSNCLCSQTEITIGPDGQPIFGDKLIKRMQDQKERIVGG